MINSMGNKIVDLIKKEIDIEKETPIYIQIAEIIREKIKRVS